MADTTTFDSYFQKADLDRDGKVSGMEALQFFKGANLPQPILAKIWHAADQGQTGVLTRQEFYNALKLVTVAQSGRELTQEIIKAALVGPASAKIPAPKIELATTQPISQQPIPRTSFNSQPSGLPSQPGSLTPQPSGLPGSQPPHQGSFTTQTSGLPSQQGSFTSQPSGLPGTLPSGLPSPQQTPRNSFTTQTVPPQSFQGQQMRGPSPMYQPQGIPRPMQQRASFDSWPPARPSTPGVQGQLFTSVPSRPITSAVSGPSSVPSRTGSPFGGDTFSAANARPTSPAPSPQFRPVTPQPGLRPGAPPASGPRPPPPTVGGSSWPEMTTSDVERYSQIFHQVDTDRDRKISGLEARNLFLSWGLPREVLKQVWDLSDQDGDSMLSLNEFCTALYMMERFREGRPLPPVLPAGFHSSSTPQSIAAARRLAEAQAAVEQHSAGYNLPSWQQNPRMLAPGSMPGVRMPMPMPGNHQNRRVSQTPREEAAPQPENKILDSKEKMQFYRDTLQELVLHKRKCDNRLAEITDRASSEKREEESLSKRYEEKYKQALETNSRLVSEEAAARELQVRRAELQHAIAEIDRGGNPNALLQTRADRISNDLDELEKALVQRGQILGFHVEAAAPVELPFGWKLGLQTNAAEWDENWDKFDDEGFTALQDIMDQPSAASAPGWDDSNVFADGFDFSSEAVHEHLDEPVGAESPRAESETTSLNSPKQSELWSPKSSPAKSPLSMKRSSEDIDSFAQRPSFASSTDGFDHGPNFDSGDHPDEQPWSTVFTDSMDDVRASWGLQHDGATSSQSGFDSLDFGSLKINTSVPTSSGTTSGTHAETSNGWMDNTDFFGSSVPSTPLFKTDSPTVPSTPLFKTDSPTAANKSGAFFDDSSRLDSFASTRSGVFDESDPFAGTGPFGGTRTSGQWSTF